MAAVQGGGSGGAAMQAIDDGEDSPVPHAGDIRPVPSGHWNGAEDLAVTLSLDDLLPDANGEIVIMGAEDGFRLSIVTDQRVCDSGVIAQHVTADGYDVGGLSYYAFEGGTTLYYSKDLALTIAQTESR